MEYAIEIAGLWYKYPIGKDFILKGIDLQVKNGEFLGILGPTGSGKTTLCMCLNGLIPHYKRGELKGNIKIKGKDTLTQTVAELAGHVGVVFQDPETQLITSSVEDEVASSLTNRGLDRAKVREIVRETLGGLAIGHLKDRIPQTCSGGEKQKITIAATIALNPDIVVFDEATSDLDTDAVREVFSLAENLHRNGKTIVFVTHEMEHLVEYATRIIVLADGEIRLDGAPEAVLSEWRRLTELGLRLPQVSQLAVELRDRGWPLETIPLTIQQTKEQLTHLRETKRNELHR